MFTITLTEISLVRARHVAIGIHGAKEKSGTSAATTKRDRAPRNVSIDVEIVRARIDAADDTVHALINDRVRAGVSHAECGSAASMGS
jgi:hypothetical protein